LGLLAAIASRHERTERTRWVRWWMRRLLRGLGVQVHEHGLPHGAPTLLVANHVSWLDIPCLLARADGVFVAKAEVADWPLIGRLATGVGTLFLERGCGAAATVAQMSAVLAAGENVAIFPEGTSTDGRAVRAFHARLFQAALTAAAPVQAVAIRYPHPPGGAHPTVPFIGDDSFVPHLWRLLGEELIDVELAFLPPMPATGCGRRMLAERSRKQIILALTAACGAPVDVTDASSALQAAVTPDREHAGPRNPETHPCKTLTRAASPAPGA
jgi:1-acyl-sn-glycerol-3-phosphate acyltransferase